MGRRVFHSLVFFLNSKFILFFGSENSNFVHFTYSKARKRFSDKMNSSYASLLAIKLFYEGIKLKKSAFSFEGNKKQSEVLYRFLFVKTFYVHLFNFIEVIINYIVGLRKSKFISIFFDIIVQWLLY